MCLILAMIFSVACNGNPTAPEPPKIIKPINPPTIRLFTAAWVHVGYMVVDQDQTKIAWHVTEAQNITIVEGANILYTFSTPLDHNGVQAVWDVKDERIFQTPNHSRGPFILTVSNSLGSVSQTATIE